MNNTKKESTTVTPEEINATKHVNMVEYLLKTEPTIFSQRSGGELECKIHDGLVIYPDHAYHYNLIETKNNKRYKDLIGVIRYLHPNIPFYKVVKSINKYSYEQGHIDENGNIIYPRYNLFS